MLIKQYITIQFRLCRLIKSQHLSLGRALLCTYIPYFCTEGMCTVKVSKLPNWTFVNKLYFILVGSVFLRCSCFTLRPKSLIFKAAYTLVNHLPPTRSLTREILPVRGVYIASLHVSVFSDPIPISVSEFYKTSFINILDS